MTSEPCQNAGSETFSAEQSVEQRKGGIDRLFMLTWLLNAYVIDERCIAGGTGTGGSTSGGGCSISRNLKKFVVKSSHSSVFYINISFIHSKPAKAPGSAPTSSAEIQGPAMAKAAGTVPLLPATCGFVPPISVASPRGVARRVPGGDLGLFPPFLG